MAKTRFLLNCFLITSLIFLMHAQALWAGQNEKITLQKCIEIAFKNNYNIQLAKQKLAQAEAKFKEAEAGLGINLTSTVNVDKQLKGDNTAQSKVSLNIKQTIGSILPSGSYQGSAQIAYQQANIQIESARLELEKTKQALVVDLYTAYFNYLKDKRLVEVNMEAVANGKVSLEQIKKKEDVGTATYLDVLKAESQQADLEQSLAKAENNLKLAGNVLNDLLGIEDGSFEIEDQNLGAIDKPGKLSDYLSQALQNRTEILQASKTIENSQLSREVTEHEQKPVLTFTSQYNKDDQSATVSVDSKTCDLSAALSYTLDKTTDISSDFDESSDDWTVGLKIDIPLWDGNVRKEKIAQADLQVIQGKTALEQQKQEAAYEVKQAYLALDESVIQLEVNQKRLKQAEESLRVTEKSYKSGVVELNDLLAAQLNLLETRTDVLQGEIDCRVNWIKLKKAAGLEIYMEIGSDTNVEKQEK